MFHKKQQLSLFDLAEKSSVRPLGVNLDLAKRHGTAQQFRSNSVFVTLAVIYCIASPCRVPGFSWLHPSPRGLCVVPL